MGSRLVEFGISKPREEIVSALEKAAADIGWRARTREMTRTDYKLGSVSEVETCEGTEIALGRWLMLKAIVRIYGSGDSRFYISTGLGSGGAGKKEIEAYLSRVSEHLL